MNYPIWEIIANTPWWVFVLFIYLMRTSWLATKPRFVPVGRLFIFPVILMTLSIVSLHYAVFTPINIGVLIGFFIIGAMLGWLQFRMLGIKAVKDTNKLYIPGTWSLFVIVLTIFGIKYYLGYKTTIDPQMLTDPTFSPFLFAVNGFFLGLFSGRLFYAFRCLKTGPFIAETR